jgi:hypothetical protein
MYNGVGDIVLAFALSHDCSFRIDDLKEEQSFQVNMDISVCFESNGICEIKMPVFENMRLPKPMCNWNTDFAIPGKLACINSNT